MNSFVPVPTFSYKVFLNRSWRLDCVLTFTARLLIGLLVLRLVRLMSLGMKVNHISYLAPLSFESYLNCFWGVF
jgi:hypothetical protein